MLFYAAIYNIPESVYVRIDVQFRVRYIVFPCQVARLKNEVKKTEDENNLLIKEGKWVNYLMYM